MFSKIIEMVGGPKVLPKRTTDGVHKAKDLIWLVIAWRPGETARHCVFATKGDVDKAKEAAGNLASIGLCVRMDNYPADEYMKLPERKQRVR